MNVDSAIVGLFREQTNLSNPIIVLDNNYNIILANNGFKKEFSAVQNYNIIIANILDNMYNTNQRKIVKHIDVIKIISDASKYYWVLLQETKIYINTYIIIYFNQLNDQSDLIEVLGRKSDTCIIDNVSTVYSMLNEQEHEVLRLLILGYSQKLMTARLRISRTQLNRIFTSISKKVYGVHLSSKQIKDKVLQEHQPSRVA